jgi:hypothetical protein
MVPRKNRKAVDFSVYAGCVFVYDFYRIVRRHAESSIFDLLQQKTQPAGTLAEVL